MTIERAAGSYETKSKHFCSHILAAVAAKSHSFSAVRSQPEISKADNKDQAKKERKDCVACIERRKSCDFLKPAPHAPTNASQGETDRQTAERGVCVLNPFRKIRKYIYIE